MEQSKRHSALEAIVNVVLGMIIGFSVSQMAHVYEAQIQTYIWTGFTWKLSASSNLLMTIVLTILSLARGYICRRIFNNIQKGNFK